MQVEVIAPKFKWSMMEEFKKHAEKLAELLIAIEKTNDPLKKENKFFYSGLTRGLNCTRSPKFRIELDTEEYWTLWRRHLELEVLLTTITECKTIKTFVDYAHCISQMKPDIIIRAHL
eukprot:UN26381